MRKRAALVLALLALALAACGGDDEALEDSAEPIPAPELSVPGGDAPSLGGTGEETGTGEATTPEAESPGATETQAPGEGDGSAPQDSPENDTPPPPGSPAERFEEFCAENPSAC